MIFLGVEYGAKYVLENTLPVPAVSTGLVNLKPNPSSTVATGRPTQTGGATVTFPAEHQAFGAPLSAKCVAPGTGAAKEGLIIAAAGRAPVTPGVAYTLSYWTTVTAITAGKLLTMQRLWYKASGTLISSAEQNFTPTVGVQQRVDMAGVTAPSEAAFVEIRVFGSEIGTAEGAYTMFASFYQVSPGSTPGVPIGTQEQINENEIEWASTVNASAATLLTNVARAVFNDSTDPDYVGDLNPESSGLDAPEIREDSAERVETDGAIFGDFFSGKRPVILQGTIIAGSQAQRNERVGKLRAASNAKISDATLSWEDSAAGKVFINLRRQQPIRITKGYVKEFMLAMVAADSRILSYAVTGGSDKGITTASQEKFAGLGGVTAIEGASAPVIATPENIKAADAAYATIETNAPAEFSEFAAEPLYTSKHGFTIPNTAAILKVSVLTKQKVNKNTSWRYYRLWIHSLAGNPNYTYQQLYGAPLGFFAKGMAETGQVVTSTEEEFNTSAATNGRWSIDNLLTPAFVNTETFGVRIYYRASKTEKTLLSVNSVKIKVEYAEPLTVTVINNGTVPAPGVIKIFGPFEQFYIKNEANGEVITYKGKVETGKWLVFDTEAVTIVEEGTGITTPISRFENVEFPNDWIQIEPGANIIVAAGRGGTANTEMQVEYRDAWE